jgi:hypothetical protein
VAEGKVKDIADDQPLSNILRRKGTFILEVRMILNGTRAAALKPVCQCIRIADELGIGIGDQ